jgi:hypothetical protein
MEAPAKEPEQSGIQAPAGLSGAINLFSPESLDGAGLLRALERLESLVNWAYAGQAQILHLLERHFLDGAGQYSPLDPAGGTVSRTVRRLDEELATSLAATEAACVLRIAERTALGRLRTGRALCEDFPATLTALRDGHISHRHAQTIVDEALSLPVEARAGFEEHLLAEAPRQTVAELARASRRLRETHHPASIAERSRKAASDRTVLLSPDLDGMSWLSAYLPAETATTAYQRLTTLARAVQGPDEPRTLTQLRADVLGDLLTGTSPRESAPRGTDRTGISMREAAGRSPAAPDAAPPVPVEVLVSMDVRTLLGLADDPAELEGYGPIGPDNARNLAALAGSFIPLLVSDSGNVLAMGRKARLPSTLLRRWLRFRDGTCRFPGCGRSAAHSDIDHSIPWSRGGPTNHDNLAHLCRKHHLYKSATCWNLQENDAGTLTWKSPTGRHYTTAPPGRFADPPPF